MTVLDSVLLDVTESSCRMFQVLTGRTNVWLAAQLTNLSIVAYFVWMGLSFWSGDFATRVVVGLFCSALLTQTVFKEPIEMVEKRAYWRVSKGFRNPRRVRDVMLRLTFLTLCLALYYPVLLAYNTLRVRIAPLPYSVVVLTTVVLYLLACDPLPPCAAKLTARLRRAREPILSTR